MVIPFTSAASSAFALVRKFLVAEAHRALGERKHSFDWLEFAVQRHAPRKIFPFGSKSISSAESRYAKAIAKSKYGPSLRSAGESEITTFDFYF